MPEMDDEATKETVATNKAHINRMMEAVQVLVEVNEQDELQTNVKPVTESSLIDFEPLVELPRKHKTKQAATGYCGWTDDLTMAA